MSPFSTTSFSVVYADAKGRQKNACLGRILRIICNLIPHRDMLMTLEGLYGAVTQIPYVMLFLGGWIYLYAVGGMMFFQNNDPYHYNSIEMAIVTLIKVVIFETWAENFYINYYGCNKFPGMNPQVYTNNPYETVNVSMPILCAEPEAQPVISCIYYISLSNNRNSVFTQQEKHDVY